MRGVKQETVSARNSILDAIDRLRLSLGTVGEPAARFYLAAQVAIAKAASR